MAFDERDVGRGDVIALRPPPNRFFPRPLGFLKVVRGVPGDVVTRDGRLFLVNGEPVGVAKSHAHNGEPLTPGPEGVIPPDHYFVWSPHPDSFDSRYADIGWIASDRILGRADRLL
ncbi:MAG: S26 family signal peptidase [Chromatiales bacterium]|nr:S26 family signal peptidase [Chromatiales bacterium]